jgi:hypothetical protein
MTISGTERQVLTVITQLAGLVGHMGRLAAGAAAAMAVLAAAGSSSSSTEDMAVGTGVASGMMQVMAARTSTLIVMRRKRRSMITITRSSRQKCPVQPLVYYQPLVGNHCDLLAKQFMGTTCALIQLLHTWKCTDVNAQMFAGQPECLGSQLDGLEFVMIGK